MIDQSTFTKWTETQERHFCFGDEVTKKSYNWSLTWKTLWNLTFLNITVYISQRHYNYDTNLYEICVIVVSSFFTFFFVSSRYQWYHVLVDHWTLMLNRKLKWLEIFAYTERKKIIIVKSPRALFIYKYYSIQINRHFCFSPQYC